MKKNTTQAFIDSIVSKILLSAHVLTVGAVLFSRELPPISIMTRTRPSFKEALQGVQVFRAPLHERHENNFSQTGTALSLRLSSCEDLCTGANGAEVKTQLMHKLASLTKNYLFNSYRVKVYLVMATA